jgi:hypothetical protein
MAHKISGSEVHAAAALLPGYAAIHLNPPRAHRLRLHHMALLVLTAVAGLVTAGAQGLLP